MIIASHQANLFAPLWLGWLILFIILELGGIYYYRKHPTEHHKGSTLSEMTWRLFKRSWYMLSLLVIFLSVLGAHLLFEI